MVSALLAKGDVGDFFRHLSFHNALLAALANQRRALAMINRPMFNAEQHIAAGVLSP
jgi:hypothetical protein